MSDVGASSRWAEMRVKWKVSVFPDQAGCTDVPKSRMKGKNISMQGSFASPDERISSFYRLLDAWPGFLRKAAQERSYSHTHTHTAVTVFSHVWNLVWEPHRGQSMFRSGSRVSIDPRVSFTPLLHHGWGWSLRLYTFISPICSTAN